MDGGPHNRSAVRGGSRFERMFVRLNLWILIVGIVLFGGLVSLFALRGAHIVALRHHLLSTAAAQQTALLDRQDLQDRLALKDDLTAIEDAARERLGWVKPGDVRVIFVGPQEGGG